MPDPDRFLVGHQAILTESVGLSKIRNVTVN